MTWEVLKKTKEYIEYIEFGRIYNIVDFGDAFLIEIDDHGKEHDSWESPLIIPKKFSNEKLNQIKELRSIPLEAAKEGSLKEGVCQENFVRVMIRGWLNKESFRREMLSIELIPAGKIGSARTEHMLKSGDELEYIDFPQ